MDFSIIIISYNTKELLTRCLDSIYHSLQGSLLSFEVIVVDNASKDGSVQLLKTKYPRVVKIFNKENLGFGKGNNMGIQKSRGTNILLLNSDIKVEDQAIIGLYDFLKRTPDAFVGGKLFDEDGTPQSSCGPELHLFTVFLMLFARGDRIGITRYSPDRVTKVNWISGACILATKKAFIDAGLFDEEIFLYMEEIDLLYRAAQKGYTVFFYPDAHFTHTGAASSGSKRQPVVNIYRGLRYFYRKHYAPWARIVLELFLTLKARIAMGVGKLTGDTELVTIYAKALQFHHE